MSRPDRFECTVRCDASDIRTRPKRREEVLLRFRLLYRMTRTSARVQANLTGILRGRRNTKTPTLAHVLHESRQDVITGSEYCVPRTSESLFKAQRNRIDRRPLAQQRRWNVWRPVCATGRSASTISRHKIINNTKYSREWVYHLHNTPKFAKICRNRITAVGPAQTPSRHEALPTPTTPVNNRIQLQYMYTMRLHVSICLRQHPYAP